MKKFRPLLVLLILLLLAGCEFRPATINIASFNIQTFGEAVFNNPEQMDILARIAREFDVMAIQEIRNADPIHMKRFVTRINQEPGPRPKAARSAENS